MTRLLNAFVILFCIMAAPFLSASAQESKTVTAEGVAAIQGNARDIARDAALEDAQKRAVEQAVGILIDSQTQVENFQLISDKILSQTKGYIKRYTIVGETVDSSLLRVRINAEVALDKLTDDLTGIGILLGQMHKPRTIVMIAEQNIGQEWHAWWWGQHSAHGTETELDIVDNTFTDIFTQKGFEFIDHAVAARELRVSKAYRVQDLTVAQAKTIGRDVDAEVVIIGKALSKLYGEVGGGMKSVQADVAVKAVRTDTGQVIAAVTAHGAGVHITNETAGVTALKKAGESAANEMMDKILTVYAREAGSTRSVNITISGLNKAQFVKFKDVLRNQVRGIKDLHERSFTGSTARISVDSKMSAQVLSDELSLRDFGTFGVEIVASTPNSLELRVTPK
ncbi:MAG TPA: flagellar assembly protein T N-terminal domain-containing protein [Nitrospirota bacterium]|nr:flagellar assembly protein T N-terminal domain-containing protein [Nitrospirota bacterium]